MSHGSHIESLSSRILNGSVTAENMTLKQAKLMMEFYGPKFWKEFSGGEYLDKPKCLDTVKHLHSCREFDGLVIDENDPEFSCCLCFK